MVTDRQTERQTDRQTNAGDYIIPRESFRGDNNIYLSTTCHYYNLLLCFIPLEMHVRLICAIKFYLLTYLLICISMAVS